MSVLTFAALTAAEACSDPSVAAARARAVDEAVSAGETAGLPRAGDPVCTLIDWAREHFIRAIYREPPLLPFAAALYTLMALLGVDPQSFWAEVPGELRTAVLAELRAGIVRRAEMLAAQQSAGDEDGQRRVLAEALLSLVSPPVPDEPTGTHVIWLEVEGVPGMVAGIGHTEAQAGADAAFWAGQLAAALLERLRARAVWPEGKEDGARRPAIERGEA